MGSAIIIAFSLKRMDKDLDMWRVWLCVLCALFLASCTSGYMENASYQELLKERKIQATRKFQIIRDGKINIVLLATYLNDIEQSYYKNLVYFFLEFYAPSQEPINLKRMSLEISTPKGWETPRYIRKLHANEYDEVMSPNNKWSSCYLVAFAKTEGLKLNAMRLRVSVDEEYGELDFEVKSVPFQVL